MIKECKTECNKNMEMKYISCRTGQDKIIKELLYSLKVIAMKKKRLLISLYTYIRWMKIRISLNVENSSNIAEEGTFRRNWTKPGEK